MPWGSTGPSRDRGPDRPLGIRAFNHISRFCERFGGKPGIDGDRLLERVERRSGLDWGDRWFLEPYRVLTQAMNNEAELHPLGRIIMSVSLDLFLQNRIRLNHAVQTHPEQIAPPLERPLYVIGLPRTGTTLLYNLLCQDPQCRPLMGWESLYPIRTARFWDRRRARGRRFESLLNRMAPRLKSVHEFVSDGPEECTWLLHSTFVSSAYVLQAKMPTYAQYLADLSPEIWHKVYTDYANTLKLLQAGTPGRHWVLKSPAHQVALSALMDVVPNASIVQTHRDPKKMIGSCCSLFSIVRGIYSDAVRDRELGDEVLKNLESTLDRAMTAREERPERFYDVSFEQLMQDPIAVVKRIYHRFGYDYDRRMEDGMRRWLAANPQGKHGKHAYDLEQFGLTEQRVDDTFGDYQQRYEAATRQSQG